MDIRKAHLYDNQLPFWLKIGPICWEASYSSAHHYMIYRTGGNHDVVINLAKGHFPGKNLVQRSK